MNKTPIFRPEAMAIEASEMPTYPPIATVEQICDFMIWLIESGRGAYRVEIRERYIALPPEKEAWDDRNKVAFLRGLL